MAGRTERLLIEDAEKFDWIGMRAPGSGSRPDSATGDVWIGRQYNLRKLGSEILLKKFNEEGYVPPLSELFIIEEKYNSTDNRENRFISESTDKLKNMIELAETLGAQPLMAVRWSIRQDWSPGPSHYLIDAREILNGKRYVSINPDNILDEDWLSTDEFFRQQ